MSTIKTNEFFDKFFEETKLHPQIQKNLEIIEYHVKHNLPVEKKVIKVEKILIYSYFSRRCQITFNMKSVNYQKTKEKDTEQEDMSFSQVMEL